MSNDFTTSTLRFFDFTTNSRCKPMEGCACRFTWRKGYKRLTFSKAVTEAVFFKDLTGLRLACNDLTGEWFFVFCKEGAAFRYMKNAKGDITAIEFNNANLVDFIKENIAKGDGDQVRIKLSDDRSKLNTQATFKVESWSLISSK